MRELSHFERWVATVAGVVTIVGGLAGLANMAGLLPQRSESQEDTRLEATSDTPGEKEEEATPVEIVPTPPRETMATTRRQEIPKPSEFPVQARLEDGQQHVMLGGDLGVGVTFSEVASTPIATLQIQHEGEQELKALLGGGDAFTVEVKGARYRISVLRLSFEAREVQVQIDKIGG